MKILFTDLDDTLLNKSSQISEYSKGILRKFVNMGNLLVPTSGRPLLSVQKCVAQAGISDIVSYIIAYNGALIWDCQSDKELWSSKLPAHTALAIQQKSFEKGIHFQTYANEHIYTPVCDEEIKKYTRKILLPVVYTPDPVGTIKADPYKALVIDLNDHERLEDFKAECAGMLDSDVNIFFSNMAYLEFVNKNAGKGMALKKLCELTDTDIHDSYAAGDQENDISMIEAAGTGIAVLNATEKVKSVADVITPEDCDHDGLARFIQTVCIL